MQKELTPEEKIIKYQRCAECGRKLGIFAYFEGDGTMSENIACTWDRNHKGISRKYEPPAQPVYEIWREEMTTEVGPVKTRQLERYYGMNNLPEADLNKVIDTLWPKAPAAEKYKALILCKQYGLNPLRKQVHLICFNEGKQNESWVCAFGIQANRQIAAESGPPYTYLDNTPRAMTAAEQEELLGEVDKMNLWSITRVKDLATGMIAQGIGCWPRANNPYGSDKGNTKINMANIRSERQSLDRLRPGKMPQGVEIIDEQYAPTVEVIDHTTGEITSPGTSEASQQVSQSTVPPETTGQQKAEPPTDLTVLEFKNAGEFYTAVLKHFPQLNNQAQVNKEISMFNLSIDGQRKAAWLQIVGAYRLKGT